MFVKAMIAAVAAVQMTSAFEMQTQRYLQEFLTIPNADTEAPGALQVYLNVSNLSQIEAAVESYVAAKILQGKTLNINKDITVENVTFSIKELTVDSVSVGESSLSFIDTSDDLRTLIGNVDINLSCDITGPSKPVLLEIDTITLTGLKFQLDLGTTSTDGVNWQFSPASNLLLTLEDFELHATTALWNRTLKTMNSSIKSAIDYGLSLVSGAANGVLDAINDRLAKDLPDLTIDLAGILPLGLEGLADNAGQVLLDIAMTEYPQFSNAEGEISLNINALFDEADISSYVSKPTS